MNRAIPKLIGCATLASLFSGAASLAFGQAVFPAPSAVHRSTKKLVAEAQQQGLATVVVYGRLLDDIETPHGKQKTFRIATTENKTFSDGVKIPIMTIFDGVTLPTNPALPAPVSSGVTVQVTGVEGAHKRIVPIVGLIRGAEDPTKASMEFCVDQPNTVNCTVPFGSSALNSSSPSSLYGTRDSEPKTVLRASVQTSGIPGIQMNWLGPTTVFSSLDGQHTRVDEGTVIRLLITKEKGLAIR